MLEQIKGIVDMLSGVAEIPKKQAERFAQQLAKQGDLGTSQVSKFAESIVKKSRANVDMVRALVASEVKRQVRSLGLATRDDIERISRRLNQMPKSSDISKLEARVKRAEARAPAKKKSPVSRSAKPKRRG